MKDSKIEELTAAREALEAHNRLLGEKCSIAEARAAESQARSEGLASALAAHEARAEEVGAWESKGALHNLA